MFRELKCPHTIVILTTHEIQFKSSTLFETAVHRHSPVIAMI